MSNELSTRQRVALRAVCRAILPAPVSDLEEVGLEQAAERAEQLIASLADSGDRARLLALLTVLGSPIANLALGGRAAALQTMERSDREKVLRGWAQSRSGLRRAGFQALKRLSNIAYYCWPAQDGSHPTWSKTGYPGPLPQPTHTVEPLPTLAIDRDTTLECDAVVVGSGAGGGVVAGVLAAAGHSVVVLERGVNPDAGSMTQIEGDMLASLYLHGGLVITQSGSIPILAGSCLGGGTVINYTTSFPLPKHIREEWDRLSGVSLFSSQRFTESLDRVSRRLNVGTDWTTPGVRDAILERGLKRLGWHVDVIPRNVTACPEGLECGYCGYGCRHGAKNDTARTYLLDAARAGARLIERCTVSKVISQRRVATGVEATARSADGATHRLNVRARAVVVSCGAVQTPALLMRSGLSNPRIGCGLRLHPATALAGVFAERVEPWSGTLQTRYSDQFADLHAGYGAKFETAPVHFALPSSAFGWEDSRQARADFERLAHTSIVGILLRDRDAGRVSISRTGHPRVHYELSSYDVSHLRTAYRGAARVLEAAGASEILSLHTPPVRSKLHKGRWLDDFMGQSDRQGYRNCRMSYVSFHQMATAALGSDPQQSVVAETGESHEVRGLYVADASVFPTSSGVNPMITIMALADHVARALAESL